MRDQLKLGWNFARRNHINTLSSILCYPAFFNSVWKACSLQKTFILCTRRCALCMMCISRSWLMREYKIYWYYDNGIQNHVSMSSCVMTCESVMTEMKVRVLVVEVGDHILEHSLKMVYISRSRLFNKISAPAHCKKNLNRKESSIIWKFHCTSKNWSDIYSWTQADTCRNRWN